MITNLRDLDYFRTKDNTVWLVKGYYFPPDQVIAYPVFWPDKKGERFHPSLKIFYRKETSDINNERIFKLYPNYRSKNIPRAVPRVPLSEIVEIYYPQDKIRDFLQREKGTIWIRIFQSFVEVAKIPPKDIGIFGSYLIDLATSKNGKQIKDIDFVIYGIENCRKLQKTIDEILKKVNLTHISGKHIEKHILKFGSQFDPQVNSFKKTLSRKWSSIQVTPEILSTVRFVYKDNEIPPDLLKNNPLKSKIQIRGEVIDDFGTNFMPRHFKILTDRKVYKIITYFWAFQSPVMIGDQVSITGQLHKNNKVISLDDSRAGIKILN